MRINESNAYSDKIEKPSHLASSPNLLRPNKSDKIIRLSPSGLSKHSDTTNTRSYLPESQNQLSELGSNTTGNRIKNEITKETNESTKQSSYHLSKRKLLSLLTQQQQHSESSTSTNFTSSKTNLEAQSEPTASTSGSVNLEVKRNVSNESLKSIKIPMKTHPPTYDSVSIKYELSKFRKSSYDEV